MAYLNILYFIFFFSHRNLQAVYYMKWKKETEMPTLTLSHYHFGNTNLNMTLNKSSNQKNILAFNYSRYIESISVIYYLGL